MRYWLVMPAAGAGRRFGESLPKQYAALCGRTVIEWALSPFLADARCRAIVVAVAPGDCHWATVAPRLPSIMLATGGAERSESVRNALAALAGHAAAADWVLIHDAARPCLTEEDRDRLLDRLAAHPLGGLLAAPAPDTLKRASPKEDEDATVDCTLERRGLWRALTPQMFRYGSLCAALDRAIAAGRYPTDEAQAFEWLGEHPRLIEALAANPKITSSGDLALARALIDGRVSS